LRLPPRGEAGEWDRSAARRELAAGGSAAGRAALGLDAGGAVAAVAIASALRRDRGELRYHGRTEFTMDLLLQRLLSATPAAAAVVPDLATFWQRYDGAAAGLTLPIERAVAGGFAADRLGYAFAAGYTEALRQLLPALGETRAALAATEAGGVHPRAIQAHLTAAPAGFTLSGDKTFVTLGPQASELLVVASEGLCASGRNRLVLCRIPATRPGVTFQPLPPTPFAPEIPHAGVQLRQVAVADAERLPGDAYERYLKPFRTVEDLHVHAALLGWLVRLARDAAWPRPVQQELLLLITATRRLAADAADDPTLHVALGGLLAACQRLLAELEPLWPQVEPTTRLRWERDRPLLQVAGKARAQRLEVAWQRVAALAPPAG
jgi:hypothetical protein